MIDESGSGSETLSELDKLKNAAALIRRLTHGRMEMRPGVLSDVSIHPENSAYVGIEMTMKPNLKLQRYEVSFYARVRRMGDALDAAGLNELGREIHAAYAALAALELYTLHPTQEDMEAFRDYLSRQQERNAPEPSGPGLGQTI